MSGAAGAPWTARLVWRALAVFLVAVQLVVLYAPSVPGPPLVPGADKVVHLLVFAVPALVLILAGGSPRLVVPLLVLHAGASEIVQGAWLPDRSGDVLDALADVCGVALGWASWHLVRSGATPVRW